MMSSTLKPRYPVFVPSKGRAAAFLTAKMFAKDGVDFRVVVEPQDVDNYAKVVGSKRVLVLPENNRGLVFSRNWIKQYSISEGHARHWQFDDDIRQMRRLHKNYRIPVNSGAAIAAAETFVDRYENVALASFNSWFFVPTSGSMAHQFPPFYLNQRCYTVFLMMNSIPNTWRHRYNEDTDMTLQVLACGWCTVLFNTFLIETPTTMTYTGGQTDIYVNDGRLRMSRQLERVWPGVVTTSRRFKRPQHKIKGEWKLFDTPLVRRKDIDWDALEKNGPDEMGMKLVVNRPPKSAGLRQMVREINGNE